MYGLLRMKALGPSTLHAFPRTSLKYIASPYTVGSFCVWQHLDYTCDLYGVRGLIRNSLLVPSNFSKVEFTPLWVIFRMINLLFLALSFKLYHTLHLGCANSGLYSFVHNM